MLEASSDLPDDVAVLQAMIALQNEKLSIFETEIKERQRSKSAIIRSRSWSINWQACAAIGSLWLSPDHGTAQDGRLARKPQEGGVDLAA
jgi:hypothetical protein